MTGGPVTADPAVSRVAAEMLEPEFLAAVEEGRWRVVSNAFPTVDIMIEATEPDGAKTEYGFRFDLTNFPALAPMVRIWDFANNVALPVAQRPAGNQRVKITFQNWGDDTVYRPWERQTGPHNSNAVNFPHLAWRADRTLAFALEDLHGILNLNARAHRIRAAA